MLMLRNTHLSHQTPKQEGESQTSKGEKKKNLRKGYKPNTENGGNGNLGTNNVLCNWSKKTDLILPH